MQCTQGSPVPFFLLQALGLVTALHSVPDAVSSVRLLVGGLFCSPMVVSACFKKLIEFIFRAVLRLEKLIRKLPNVPPPRHQPTVPLLFTACFSVIAN